MHMKPAQIGTFVKMDKKKKKSVEKKRPRDTDQMCFVSVLPTSMIRISSLMPPPPHIIHVDGKKQLTPLELERRGVDREGQIIKGRWFDREIPE